MVYNDIDIYGKYERFVINTKNMKYSGHSGEKRMAYRIALTLLNEGSNILFDIGCSALK